MPLLEQRFQKTHNLIGGVARLGVARRRDAARRVFERIGQLRSVRVACLVWHDRFRKRDRSRPDARARNGVARVRAPRGDVPEPRGFLFPPRALLPGQSLEHRAALVRLLPARVLVLHRDGRLRDAQALIEACDALAERSEPASDRLLVVVREWLQARLDDRERAMHDIERQTGTLREALLGARRRVSYWHLQAFDRDALSRGYARLYRRGQRAYRETVEAPGDVAFHEWRKRVKDHWYHTRLLAPAWAAPLEARHAELKTLSDLLGDEHDLSVLRDTLLADGGELLGGGAAQALLARIGRRQGELRALAQALGARIYAEPADGLRQRVLGYLDAWASELPAPRRAGA